MIDETRSDASSSEAFFSPLGEVLLAARKAKKLTQNDVSNSLRISVKQVDAIENNAFELLPESATTRGFIRNYARYLGVDAEPLLASHRQRFPSDEPASLSVKTSTRHHISHGTKDPRLKTLLAILALLVLLIWLFAQNLLPTITGAPTEPQVPTDSAPLPEAALPAIERQANTEVAAATTVLPDVASPQVSPSATQMAQASPAVGTGVSNTVATDSMVVVSTSAPSATEERKFYNHKVSMTFTAPTWVSAKNKMGKVIFEKTFAAGETGGFDDEPPLSIIIGNAQATQLHYLGQSIDLTALTKGNVARVKLP